METIRQYLIETLKAELPKFERVFKALPEDKLDYRPHPNSRSAIEIAQTMAVEPQGILEVLNTGECKADPLPDPLLTIPEILQKFTADFKASLQKITESSDQDLDQEGVMTFGGKPIWTTNRGDMAWGILFDLIHHRGQLSTYIRPMGGKVPPIYGPSGDSAEQ